MKRGGVHMINNEIFNKIIVLLKEANENELKKILFFVEEFLKK